MDQIQQLLVTAARKQSVQKMVNTVKKMLIVTKTLTEKKRASPIKAVNQIKAARKIQHTVRKTECAENAT